MQFTPFSFIATKPTQVTPASDGVVTDGLYMDFRQSTYEAGTTNWSNSVSVSSSISGTFSNVPSVVSSSISFASSINLTATYISASEAHSDFTVVVYTKYNNPANNSTTWQRSSNFRKRWVIGGADRYWIINSSGTDYGIDAISGSAYYNDNFFVDTLVGSGSNFKQYQNNVLNADVAATTANVNWATNGGSGSFYLETNPSFVKRILVYNRALTSDEVTTNYNALTGSNN